MRFIYFVPGALAGIANFVLWVYLLNPTESPIAFLWQAMGLDTLKQRSPTTENLPWILTAMLFFQGVGTWIIIVNGGLNGIPDEIFEAASLDGANAWQMAWRIKLPLIRPWIGYAALMNLAYGFQLFLEPYLLGQISSRLDRGGVGADPARATRSPSPTATSRPPPRCRSSCSSSRSPSACFIVFRSGLFGEEKEKAR